MVMRKPPVAGGLGIVAFLLPLLMGCGTAGPEGERAGDPELVFRLANELTPDGKIWDVSRLFKEELEKASPDGRIAAGEIEVVFYDQGMVGTERQILENAYFGVMEVVQINPSVATTIDPALNLFDLPYAFVSDEHHKAVLHGPIGEIFLQRLRRHNLLGLGFYGLGFRNMFYTEPAGGCIRRPEDLRGLKMRVVESPLMIRAINAMGASATPVPFSELFQAIRTGVVDGADNGAPIFIASRFYETGANCFTLTEHFTNQHVLIANLDWFESLEPKYQERLVEVAEAIVPEFDRIWDAATEDALSQMDSLGVTVNEVDDKAEFMTRVQDVEDEFFRSYPDVPRDLYEAIEAEAETVR